MDRSTQRASVFFSYSTNYLIDTDHSVIVDVEDTSSTRQAEIGSVHIMLDRIKERHDIDPERLIAESAYGSAPMLGWRLDLLRWAFLSGVSSRDGYQKAVH